MTHEERVREIRREIALVTVKEVCERICYLEELALSMYRVMWGCDDSKCPYGGECCDDHEVFTTDCKFKGRMRELGIEVE